MDQYGRIQAIGGVNEKLEGFYKVCRAHGLTGDQGVMIPASNVPDLHLSEELVEAVRAGNFSVWAARTVEEGIELLTGIEAGEWSDEDGWTQGGIYARCQERLEEMVRLMRQSTKGAAKPDNGDDGIEVSSGDEELSVGDGAHRK
jgi:predicted ATP-dependent protease